MIRKLKTFVTSLGFFDQAIAAPSMKAALEAWGADSNLFHQGVAKQTEDPDIVAATMAAPGIVLKRPVGSSEPFREHSDLPKHIDDSGQPSRAAKIVKSRSLRRPGETTDPAAERKAALEFEKEERRRERQRAKEEAAREQDRERRQQAIEKAQGALDKARRKYEGSAADIRAEIQKLEARLQTEETKWEKERARLEAALHRAR